MNLGMKLGMSALVLMVSTSGWAEQTPAEKIKNTAKKVGAEMSKAANKVEEQVCETVNGKMKCVAKKAKHRLQETQTQIENKAQEVKDEVD